MDSKTIIKEFNEYVDGFVECCTSDEQTHELLKAVAYLIEDQEERIAIMSEGGNDKKVSILQSELYNCRNELCIKCGLYRRSHEGVCNGCRYRHDGEWKEGLE